MDVTTSLDMVGLLESSLGAISPRLGLSPDLEELLRLADLAQYGPALHLKMGLKSLKDARLLLDKRDEVLQLQLQLQLESEVGMTKFEAFKLLKAVRDAPIAQPQPSHRVRALVVGCGSYALLEDLDNPPHDAAAIAAQLEAAGAEVLLLLNPTRIELDSGLRMLSDVTRKPFPQARLYIKRPIDTIF